MQQQFLPRLQRTHPPIRHRMTHEALVAAPPLPLPSSESQGAWVRSACTQARAPLLPSLPPLFARPLLLLLLLLLCRRRRSCCFRSRLCVGEDCASGAGRMEHVWCWRFTCKPIMLKGLSRERATRASDPPAPRNSSPPVSPQSLTWRHVARGHEREEYGGHAF